MPEIILPIGVSFIVFEKITYLVDIYRRISRPAERGSTYLLYVLLSSRNSSRVRSSNTTRCESQLRTLPTASFADISTGFQRFMVGVAKKTLIA